MSYLDPKMQERLDKWRKRAIPVPSAQKLTYHPPKLRPVRRDHGDDLREFEEKK